MRIVIVCLGVLALGGCAILEKPTPDAHTGPYPYHASAEETPPLRRVVMLPLSADSCPTMQREQLERSIQAAVGQRHLFELVPVSERDVADTHLVSTRKTGVYRTEDLILLSRRFGAEAVLHGVITHFEAYPRVRIGLRLALLDCRTGKVPWATDVVLDASDRIIEQDVHNYHDTVRRETGSLMDYEQVLISPLLFGEYAAHRVSNTMERALRPASLTDTKP